MDRNIIPRVYLRCLQDPLTEKKAKKYFKFLLRSPSMDIFQFQA